MNAENSYRAAAADFWDDYVSRWLGGDQELRGPLARWYLGYQGAGPGEVNAHHYPDPFVGDLRGVRSEPEVVLLGVNPGIGYDELQASDGVWANRVRREGLSYCFHRSPEEDPETWLRVHGKRSRYWLDRMKFASLWLGRSAAASDVLSLELYPWHSRGIHGSRVKPDPDLVRDFIVRPLSEFREVQHVFAFSVDWRAIADRLGFPRLHHEIMSLNKIGRREWTLSIFALSERQRLVVSTRSNSTPPLEAEFGLLRDRLRDVG